MSVLPPIANLLSSSSHNEQFHFHFVRDRVVFKRIRAEIDGQWSSTYTFSMEHVKKRRKSYPLKGQWEGGSCRCFSEYWKVLLNELSYFRVQKYGFTIWEVEK